MCRKKMKGGEGGKNAKNLQCKITSQDNYFQDNHAVLFMYTKMFYADFQDLTINKIER